MKKTLGNGKGSSLVKSFTTTILNTSKYQYLTCPKTPQIQLLQQLNLIPMLEEVTGIQNPITHFALFADCDPTTFESAVKEEKWRKAMNDEIDAIERNDTWELCDLPRGQKTIGVKWVFKTKLNENGEVDKYKARLVAKGYKQQYGTDYTEMLSPVARHDTIRLVVALAAQQSWQIFQLDVKSAFLHGYLEEQVYVDQPPGYVKIGTEEKVYKLKKVLYGLKQAPRAWYSRIESYFIQSGISKCPYEHTLFLLKLGMKGKFSSFPYMLMSLFLPYFDII